MYVTHCNHLKPPLIKPPLSNVYKRETFWANISALLVVGASVCVWVRQRFFGLGAAVGRSKNMLFLRGDF